MLSSCHFRLFSNLSAYEFKNFIFAAEKSGEVSVKTESEERADEGETNGAKGSFLLNFELQYFEN